MSRALALTAMAVLALATWLLQHSFAGISHDSVLYTLFALARLHPDSVATDVFLRFGSQDAYTVFTPIYSAAINSFGMEHAAALLLLVSQVALFACAWLLARRLMAALDATLGVAFLALLPGEYGAGSTFHYLESFLTPRVPAEALIVAAVFAAVKERYWIAAGCVVAGMLLHPIMSAPGAAFLVLTYVVPRHPRLMLTVLGVGFIATVGVVVAIAPSGQIQDKDWLFVIHSTSNYLFVTSWSLADWSRMAANLTLLAMGCRVGATPLLRRLCAGLLATGACGMVIALVFSDLLHVSLFINLQAWRWVWLPSVLALVLAPAILQDCWSTGNSGRVAVLVLASGWIFRGLPADLALDALAIALVMIPADQNQRGYWRTLLLAAWALLGLATCLDLTDRFSPTGIAAADPVLQEVRVVCADGVIPAVVLILCWAVLRRSNSNAVKLPLAAAGALLCAWLIPSDWRDYTRVLYTPELADRLASWRAEIPPQAEVLWPDNPVGTWYLLQRPSYWSADHMAGAIFSKKKALLVQRRNVAVTAVVKTSNPVPRDEIAGHEQTRLAAAASHMDLKAGVAVCADPDLKYVVSWTPLAPTPFPAIHVDSTQADGTLYLYRCTDLRT